MLTLLVAVAVAVVGDDIVAVAVVGVLAGVAAKSHPLIVTKPTIVAAVATVAVATVAVAAVAVATVAVATVAVATVATVAVATAAISATLVAVFTTVAAM